MFHALENPSIYRFSQKRAVPSLRKNSHGDTCCRMRKKLDATQCALLSFLRRSRPTEFNQSLDLLFLVCFNPQVKRTTSPHPIEETIEMNDVPRPFQLTGGVVHFYCLLEWMDDICSNWLMHNVRRLFRFAIEMNDNCRPFQFSIEKNNVWRRFNSQTK